MRLNSLKILKIAITSDSRQKILEEMRKYLKFRTQNSELKSQNKKNPFVIVTPNPEQIVYAQHDPRFADILNRADVALPDGIGIVAAMRLLGKIADIRYKMSELKRIPGVEFMEDLVKMSAKEGYPIALIGGRGNLAVEAFECLQKRFSGLTGFTIGDFEVSLQGKESEDTKILRYLDTKSKNWKELKGKSVFTLISQYLSIFPKPLVIFVGLGAPKQEYFIEQLKKLFARNHTEPEKIHGTIRNSTLDSRNQAIKMYHGSPVVFMSVGGAFEMITGRVKRAPVSLRLIGFEWLWRLVHEPWRFRRQLALVQFIWLVIREKLRYR